MLPSIIMNVVDGFVYIVGGQAGGHCGNHPERHPEGVHGPQHLHLPPGTFDQDHRRHFLLLVTCTYVNGLRVTIDAGDRVEIRAGAEHANMDVESRESGLR